MSNTITTGGIGVANGGNTGVIPTTVWPTISAGSPGSLTSGQFLTTGSLSPKAAGTLTLKSGESGETAEFDAAFINDLKLLLEVIKEVPDDHPLGDLKHDLRMRRAFKKLGG
jgi:hypothetical protein